MLRAESGNTVLRPVRASDFPLIIGWRNDPEVVYYLPWVCPHRAFATKEKALEWVRKIREREKTEIYFMIEAVLPNTDTKTIGYCNVVKIDLRNREGSYHILIGEKDFWGQKHGTEATRLIIDYAFNQMNLHRIKTSTLEYNERCKRMLKAAGFSDEGFSRKSVYKNGQYFGKSRFGIIEEDLKKPHQK